MGIRVRTQLLAGTFLGLLICGVATPRTTSFPSILPLSDHDASLTPSELPRDLYGNEVRRAVERYSVDFLGEWYEEHSPEIAIPKLPPPEG